MRLRVVAGELGGRFFRGPPGRAVRPTSERVREAWFSALGERVVGARVLDLFAGSGALGIEALSRGAAHVHFVEADARAARVVRRNVESLGLVERARISRRDVFALLAELGGRGEEFAVALADPPYGGGMAERLIRLYREDPFAGLLCLERRRGAVGEEGGDVVWERRYGDTVLTFLEAC
ncbi:MAG: 16S rRNA (guanine(966)-N(2))-methyltransferase RsmD [Gemmatimonadota bacterium]